MSNLFYGCEIQSDQWTHSLSEADVTVQFFPRCIINFIIYCEQLADLIFVSSLRQNKIRLLYVYVIALKDRISGAFLSSSLICSELYKSLFTAPEQMEVCHIMVFLTVGMSLGNLNTSSLFQILQVHWISL